MAEILPFPWRLVEAPDCLDIPPPPSKTRKQPCIPPGWDIVDTSTEAGG